MKKELNIQDIPKPYTLKKKWCIFTCFWKILYEEDIVRTGWAGITSIEQVEDEVLLLNAAFMEGWIKHSIYGN